MKSSALSPAIPLNDGLMLEEHEGTGRPTLSQLFGGIGQNRSQRTRVGSEDELLKKNRRQIDNYLRRLGALMGKDLSLNGDGMAVFSFKKFVIVVEVPVDNSLNVYIYTMVCRVAANDNLHSVLSRAMELNYMEHRTRGATLGLDGQEINLCYSSPIAGLPFAVLKEAMESFLLTATQMNKCLDVAKRTPLATENKTPVYKASSMLSFFQK